MPSIDKLHLSILSVQLTEEKGDKKSVLGDCSDFMAIDPA
jgi:hypothetical protein